MRKLNAESRIDKMINSKYFNKGIIVGFFIGVVFMMILKIMMLWA